MADRVLLTGISGFLGGHVALELLRQGFEVRGSLRSLERTDKVRVALAKAGADVSRLEFVALDLLQDKGWREAAEGCRFVQHVASPFVLQAPRDRNELIRPAVDGTRRALTAAFGAGAERVVLTSSIAAIAYGHTNRSRPYTPDDWTDLNGPHVPAYPESKTRAEREAWELAQSLGSRERLAVINPGAIVGPLLDDDPGTSGALMKRFVDGSVPALPRMTLSVIDVRDVAAAQVAAMLSAEAGGHRFILSEREMSFAEVAQVLRAAFPQLARKIPRLEAPDWAVRLIGMFDPQIRSNTTELGRPRRVDGSSGRALLGRPLIPAADAAIAMVQGLLDQHLLD